MFYRFKPSLPENILIAVNIIDLKGFKVFAPSLPENILIAVNITDLKGFKVLHRHYLRIY